MGHPNIGTEGMNPLLKIMVLPVGTIILRSVKCDL